MSERPPLLAVEHLTVSLTSQVPIIEDVNLRLGPGEILGLVGESGSGKSTLALALLGFARPGASIAGGEVAIAGEPMLRRSERELRRLRGRLVSYVPQDPASSLNPSRRLGAQVVDRILDRPADDRDRLVRRALERAQLPASDQFLRRFPHQSSGGQQQRALIAMAIVGESSLVVLDEPTTGLDVVTQAGLLQEILDLRESLGISLVYVSHDIAAVATVADVIAVMYAGRIVEQGRTQDILHRPVHPYTLGLMKSVPDHTRPTRIKGLPGVAVGVGEWPDGCAYAPRCPQAAPECRRGVPRPEEVSAAHVVRCIHWRGTPALKRAPGSPRLSTVAPAGAVVDIESLRATHRGRHEEVVAADDISFSIVAGECVALVGESGSGKTTIARCIAGLHPPAAGTIRLHGKVLAARARQRSLESRRRVQFIFQNPYESLNPRHRVMATISDAAMILRGLSRHEAENETAQVLEQVRLPVRVAERFPGELSGGERQRVAIARALAARPDVVICDEITSALDVSVQAAVLELLDNLRAELGLSILLITHDIGVVASAASRVIVLNHGKICESGAIGDVLASPSHDYTKLLLASAPRLELEAITESTEIRMNGLASRP